MMLFRKQWSREEHWSLLYQQPGGVDNFLLVQKQSCKAQRPKPRSPVALRREMRPQSPPAWNPRVVEGLFSSLQRLSGLNFRNIGFSSASGGVLARGVFHLKFRGQVRPRQNSGLWVESDRFEVHHRVLWLVQVRI